MDCGIVPGFDTKDCCISCHEDAELGYDLGCTIYTGEGQRKVCCKAAMLHIKRRVAELGEVNGTSASD